MPKKLSIKNEIYPRFRKRKLIGAFLFNDADAKLDKRTWKNICLYTDTEQT